MKKISVPRSLLKQRSIAASLTMQYSVSRSGRICGWQASLAEPSPRRLHARQRGVRTTIRAVMTTDDRSQVRQNGSAAPDGLAGKHASAPSAAAVRSMIGANTCEEHVEEVEASVSGEFPAWLQGALVRNGPGTYKGMKHLFDGYGMLAKFRFEDGRVYVSNRFVSSNSWKAFRKAGKMQYSEFGTAVSPLKNVWNTIKHFSGLGQGFTDNANVSVLPLADGNSAIAMTEAVAGTYEVRLSDLQTIRQVSFKDDVKGILTTAHPATLPDGSIVNFTSDIGGKYTVFRTQPGSSQRQKLAEIPLRSGTIPSWVHDFPYTQNYMILPETPCYFNMKALATGKPADYVIMEWKSEQDTLLHVVPLSGNGPVRTFHAPKYFTFHYMNAFESDDGKKIHFDFGAYDDPQMLKNLLLDVMREGKKEIRPAPLRRMTIELEHGDQPATMVDLMRDNSSYVQAELPRVNPRHKGRPYRYGYSISAVPPCTYSNALAKFDVQTGETLVWHEPGTLPTEPVMIPRQSDGEVAEDDGVVLSVVAGADGQTLLLCLDAKTFQELGRAHLPFNLLYSFHGNFVPAK